MSPPQTFTKEQSPVRPYLSLKFPPRSYLACVLLVLVAHERSEKSRSTAIP